MYIAWVLCTSGAHTVRWAREPAPTYSPHPNYFANTKHDLARYPLPAGHEDSQILRPPPKHCCRPQQGVLDCTTRASSSRNHAAVDSVQRCKNQSNQNWATAPATGRGVCQIATCPGRIADGSLVTFLRVTGPTHAVARGRRRRPIQTSYSVISSSCFWAGVSCRFGPSCIP